MVFVIIQDKEVEFVAADDFEESDLSDIEVSCRVIPRILFIIIYLFIRLIAVICKTSHCYLETSDHN